MPSSNSSRHSGGSRIFKRRFLVLQSSAQNQLKTKKKVTTSFYQHSKFNLASSNTPNLTQLNSMTWKTSTSTMKRGRGTTFKKF